MIRLVDMGPDPLHTKAGMVVDFVPDGTLVRYPAVLSNAAWRCVRVALTDVEARALLQTKVDPSTKKAIAMRARVIDLTLLLPDVRGTVVDVTRQQALAAVRDN